MRKYNNISIYLKYTMRSSDVTENEQLASKIKEYETSVTILEDLKDSNDISLKISECQLIQ